MEEVIKDTLVLDEVRGKMKCWLHVVVCFVSKAREFVLGEEGMYRIMKRAHVIFDFEEILVAKIAEGYFRRFVHAVDEGTIHEVMTGWTKGRSLRHKFHITYIPFIANSLLSSCQGQ